MAAAGGWILATNGRQAQEQQQENGNERMSDRAWEEGEREGSDRDGEGKGGERD